VPEEPGAKLHEGLTETPAGWERQLAWKHGDNSDQEAVKVVPTPTTSPRCGRSWASTQSDSDGGGDRPETLLTDAGPRRVVAARQLVPLIHRYGCRSTACFLHDRQLDIQEQLDDKRALP
jgi:hypothetical protein